MRHIRPLLLLLPGILVCQAGCGTKPPARPAMVEDSVEKLSEPVNEPDPDPPLLQAPIRPRKRDSLPPELKKRLRVYVPPQRFQSRKASQRQRGLIQNGGNIYSEAAVGAGLKWLALHQAMDGHWSFQDFAQHGRCNCRGEGTIQDDVAATALGLLPFLGTGQTNQPDSSGSNNKYLKQIDAAARYLLSKQEKNGEFSGDMYAHALATLAICELFGMTQDGELRGPAQRAIACIVEGQTPQGGWRHLRKQSGYDTEVGGWQLQALKAAEWAGLEVPESTYTNCIKWLDHAATDPVNHGLAANALSDPKPRPSPAMSAIAVVGRQQLGWMGLASMQKRADDDLLFNYYWNMALFNDGGVSQNMFIFNAAWDAWNPINRDRLVQTQNRGGDHEYAHERASWYNHNDPTSAKYGRLFETAMTLLMLETYYRYPSLLDYEPPSDQELFKPKN